ncbi:2095_t:CDS:2, partial [Funneliformis caledonium]
YVKVQNELKTLQVESEDLNYILDQSKELNLHANAIRNKRHELIKENHKRSFKNYEEVMKR